MKSSFETRTLDNFWTCCREFGESLVEQFPECAESKDWMLWITNVVGEDVERRRTGVQKWLDSMNAPLKKGSAKYIKAVQSITKSPALVFHAVSYRDADAVHESCEELRNLDLPKKLKSFDEETLKYFWKHLQEINRLAYAIKDVSLPTVPTPEEIAEDIRVRRGNKQEPIVHQGLADIWKQLCEKREAVVPTSLDTIAVFVTQCATPNVLNAVQRRDDEDVWTAFELGTSPGTSEQWTLLEKALSLSTLESNIPAPMMRGIENVASKLMQDMAQGKADFSNLNVEAIGQQVLSGVSESDVASFANNIDKLIPALQRMHIP